MIDQFVGRFACVYVALDKLQAHTALCAGNITANDHVTLTIRLADSVDVVVFLCDEGQVWCFWGQQRTVDALAVARAFGEPSRQWTFNDGRVVVAMA